MSHVVVIRPYRQGDEFNLVEMIKDGVMSSMNSTFFGNLLKEITFEVMILLAAVMFIFVGMPLTACILLIIPIVILLTYVGTFIAFTTKSMEVQSEVMNISRYILLNQIF